MTTTWGPVVFPIALDSFVPQLIDNVDEVIANHPNSLADAIEALEAKVGIDNDVISGLGGVSFYPSGHISNPGAAGVPTIWVDSSSGPGFDLKYTDDLGVTYNISSGGGGGNTLDMAYDQGGPGAGRIISVDSGAVELVGSNASDYILEVSNSNAGGVIYANNTGSGALVRLEDGGTRIFSIDGNGDTRIDVPALQSIYIGNSSSYGLQSLILGNTSNASTTIRGASIGLSSSSSGSITLSGGTNGYINLETLAGGSDFIRLSSYNIYIGDGLRNTVRIGKFQNPNTGNYTKVRFVDSYLWDASPGWIKPYIALSEATSEWDDYKVNFGEVSLLNAINQCSYWSKVSNTLYPSITGDNVKIDLGAVLTGNALILENDGGIDSENSDLTISFLGDGIDWGKIGVYRRNFYGGEEGFVNYVYFNVDNTNIASISVDDATFGRTNSGYVLNILSGIGDSGFLGFSDGYSFGSDLVGGLEYNHNYDRLYFRAGNRSMAYISQDGFALYNENNINLSSLSTASGNVDVDIGTENIDTFDPNDDGACFWHYLASNGPNIRCGIISSVFDISSGIASYLEYGISELGDTSALTFSVDMDGAFGNVRLKGTATSNNWYVQVYRVLLA
jgi:hypothetical protein